MNHRTTGRDEADVRRIVVLVALGITVDFSALLYVSNGSNDLLAWTYQECVHYQPVVATGHPRGFDEVESHLAAPPVCDRWEPRLRSWLYTWLVESVLTSVLVALAATLTLRPGMAGRW